MPALLIESELNVATPLTAATLIRAAEGGPGPALLPMRSVTLDVSVVTTLPRLSSTFTVSTARRWHAGGGVARLHAEHHLRCHARG